MGPQHDALGTAFGVADEPACSRPRCPRPRPPLPRVHLHGLAMRWLPNGGTLGVRMAHDIDEPIEIVDYDARWPTWFAEDAEEVRRALGASVASSHHFGSTSVPNLAAKPIID